MRGEVARVASEKNKSRGKLEGALSYLLGHGSAPSSWDGGLGPPRVEVPVTTGSIFHHRADRLEKLGSKMI